MVAFVALTQWRQRVVGPYGKNFLDIQPAQNASVWQPQVMCWGCIIQVRPLRFGRDGTSMAQDPGKKLDQMGLW